MSIIEFFAVWAVLISVFLLGYFARRGFEISNAPMTFKRIVSGPIQGGNLDVHYVVEGLDNNIHYTRPPFILTLD